MKYSIVAVACFAVFMAAQPIHDVRAACCDFESTPFGFYQRELVTHAGDLTLTVSAEGESERFVGVVNGDDDGEGFPALLGTRAVTATNESELDFGDSRLLRFSFSKPTSQITFRSGDTREDADSLVLVTAFEATDRLLGTLTDLSYPEGLSEARQLSGSFSGASYFVVTSGSEIDNPNSLYWEVASVHTVPEPASIVLLVFAAIRIGCADRFLRRPCSI
jgi:hypothetical protein